MGRLFEIRGKENKERNGSVGDCCSAWPILDEGYSLLQVGRESGVVESQVR